MRAQHVAVGGVVAPERAHLHNLRAAVDKPFPTKLIHTVHGEGYRLAVLDA